MSTVHQRRHTGGEVKAGVWRACAGSSVQIPTVGSRVYYFPQGHVEQSSSSISLSLPIVSSPPSVPCRVLAVHHLADPDTDEVFVKFRLQPLLIPEPPRRFDSDKFGSDSDNDVIVSFAKVLTPSDANNGGGFSVPRFCADSIFPPLDYGADPPVQNLRITDIHGECFEFRHIYRGTPRRHLLTTGWSKFVNSKKLIAGDSVVFMRNKLTNDLFVGVRRSTKSNEGQNWNPHYSVGISVGPTGGFTRNGKGRVSPEAVIEAVEKAGRNMMFDVVYYPRCGLGEFVVDGEKVERAMRVYWSSGMRVKMAVETEDSSRMTWFQGTVVSLVGPDRGVWRGSVWRMLQVAWDEPEALQNMKTVSPWQVEVIAPMPPLPTTSPPTKRLRPPLNSGPLTDLKGDFPFPIMGFGSMTNQLTSPFQNYHISPASMQGARQNPFFLSPLPNINIHGALMCTNDCIEDMSHKVGVVSTDLNIGSTSSPNTQNLQLFGIDSTQNNAGNLARKVGITSFQLFGKVIHMEQPTMNDDSCCAKFDDCTSGVTIKSIDHHSLSNPCKNLHDRLGVGCQRSTVAETYAL